MDWNLDILNRTASNFQFTKWGYELVDSNNNVINNKYTKEPVAGIVYAPDYINMHEMRWFLQTVFAYTMMIGYDGSFNITKMESGFDEPYVDSVVDDLNDLSKVNPTVIKWFDRNLIKTGSEPSFRDMMDAETGGRRVYEPNIITINGIPMNQTDINELVEAYDIDIVPEMTIDEIKSKVEQAIARISKQASETIDIQALKDYILSKHPTNLYPLQVKKDTSIGPDAILLYTNDSEFIIEPGIIGGINPETIPSFYRIYFKTEVMTKAPQSLDTQQQNILTTMTTRGRYRKIDKEYTPDTLDQAKAIIDKIYSKWM